MHVAKRDLALGDDDWRAMLSRVAGVASSADLSDDGFQRVVAELRRLGFRSTQAKQHFGHREGFATPAQLALVRQLWREYHGPDPREVALNAWLTKFHHVSALRFVSSQKIKGVLFGLKAMVARVSRPLS